MRFTRSNRSRTLLLGSFFLLTSAASAAVIQSTATLPPASGYSLNGTVCLAPACFLNPVFDTFAIVGSSIVGGNQLVDTTAVLRSGVYQNLGGTPGMLLGSVAFSGTVSFTYIGRNTPTELGTFPTILNEFQFSGMFNGNTLAVRNAAQPSTGTTSIVEFQNQFLVDGSLSIFAETSFNNAPFVPGPNRTLDVINPVPEPATAVTLAAGFVALIAVSQRRKLRKLPQ